MTEPGWADAVLVLALLAPLVGLSGLVGRLSVAIAGRLAQAGALVAAACWFALLVAGSAPEVWRFAPDELTLAACVGAALIAAGAAPAAGPAVAAGLGALTATLAVATDGRPSTAALACGLLATWGVAVAARTSTGWPAVVAGVGVVLTALALVDVGDAGTAELRPLALLATGSAAVGLVAGSRPRHTVSVLVVGVVVASLRFLPGLPDEGGADALALALAFAGTVAAACTLPDRWRAGLPWRLPTPVAALALWALAVAAAPVEGAAVVAVLLAAAAVLVAAVPAPGVLVAAVPGAVLLAEGLAAGRGGVLGPLAALAGATVVALATGVGGVAAGVEEATERDQAGPDAVPAVLLAIWLVAIPGSWAFAGPGDLSLYDRGAAVAIAASMASAVLFGAAARRSPTLGWLASLPARPLPPVRPERQPRRSARSRRRAARAKAPPAPPPAPPPAASGPGAGADDRDRPRHRRRPLRVSSR